MPDGILLRLCDQHDLDLNLKLGGRIDTTPPPPLLHGTYGGVALLPRSRSRHPLRVRAADRRQPVVPKLKVWSRLPAVQLSVLPGPVAPSLERSAARPASEHDPRCRRAAESGARPSRRRRRPNLLGSPSRTRLPAGTAPATARLTTNCEAINDARACAATGPQYPRLCAAAPATIASYQRRTRLGQRLRTRLPAGWPCRRLAGSAPPCARRWCARTTPASDATARATARLMTRCEAMSDVHTCASTGRQCPRLGARSGRADHNALGRGSWSLPRRAARIALYTGGSLCSRTAAGERHDDAPAPAGHVGPTSSSVSESPHFVRGASYAACHGGVSRSACDGL